MAATPQQQLFDVVWYLFPYLDVPELLKLESVCKEITALLHPNNSSGIWQLQYRRSFAKKTNIRLIEGAAHRPRTHPSPMATNAPKYAPLPESAYRGAVRRGAVLKDFATNPTLGELRWGKASCVNPMDDMRRSRPSIFILRSHLYVFGGVVGGRDEHKSYKTDLWRVSLRSLLCTGKYEWEQCVVDGTPPASSDALTLTCINLKSPLPTHTARPPSPRFYFAVGGPTGPRDTRNKEDFWGVLEMNRKDGWEYRWLSKRELKGGEGEVRKKRRDDKTPPVDCRYFTCTFVPIRSSAHPQGFIFIFGGKDYTAEDALSSSTVVDVATWSFDDSDGNVSGLRPTARLNHTATLVKDRYVFIIGGEEWDLDDNFADCDSFESDDLFGPVGFAQPPALDIFDGKTKTWIEFDHLPWIARGTNPGTNPTVDAAVGPYLARGVGASYGEHRCDFARHTAVLAGDKIVINVPYAVYGEIGVLGGVKTVIFDTKTGRFSRPSFATQPQKTCAAAPHPNMIPRQSSPHERYKPYEPPPAACAAAVWTGSELILYGGGSLLDEEWMKGDFESEYDNDARHDQSKHSEISVLGVMDRTTDDQIVPVDRPSVAPFSRRYVWNRQLWQMDTDGGDARFDIAMWDDDQYIEEEWRWDRQAIAESKAKERQQLRERGVEVLESGEGDEYDGVEGYTNKDIDDHLCGKPLPCNKVFGKPARRTWHQAISKFFTVTGILRSDPIHWTLPKDDSQANATQTKITTFFSRRIVQSSLSGSHGYRGTKRKRYNR
ncbi:unnamed protein product [Vitrella brassicaformis CCMP3155]|uniref:F-box domain-containing protein n=2 Tax=Vitrella brassicaformis TaxID=1169539 RepID=A0A0G4FCC0_VITBC|nr:unnamed protein product [Vitrella brassicaformis CCMP3155]|eukprot:CEM10802.1 unnamed protein product [Vitrella brassicaformis CCMP3155]